MDIEFNREYITWDALKELGNIGTGNAMNALYELSGHFVDIDYPRLRLIKYQNIFEILETAEVLQTGIMVGLFGDARGVFLFMLDERFTSALLDQALGEDTRDLLNLDELERSYLCELGNVMCGAYIQALSQMTGMLFEVSVPSLCVDMGGAILSNSLFPFLKESDDILLIENGFHMNDRSYYGRILFLPEKTSLETVFDRLGV